ncbi:unnamed protein product [Prunus armeniaca]
MSGGRPMIDKWVVLNKELRAQFLLCNVAWLVREALKNLKQPWALSELRRHNVRSLNSAIAAAERYMDYRATVISSKKKKTVEKRKEIGIASDGAKGKKHNDKKKFSGCFLCQGAYRVKDCPRRKNLNAIVTEREGGAEEGSNLQVSLMVLLNSLRVIPPEDLLGEDAIEQPVLEKFMARTCVLHSHMYSIGTIRDDFSIYIDVLEEFDFKLVYISMRHRDFEERFDEVM